MNFTFKNRTVEHEEHCDCNNRGTLPDLDADLDVALSDSVAVPYPDSDPFPIPLSTLSC